MNWLLPALQVSYVLGFFHLVSFGTYGVTTAEAVLILAILVLAIHTVWYGKPLWLPLRTEMVAMAFMWFAFALSAMAVAVSGDRALALQALKTFAHFTVLWAGGMAIALLPFTHHQWVSALRLNLIISLVLSVYAAYQIPARAYDWPLAWIEISNASFKRGLEDQEEFGQLALQFQNFFRATSIFSEPSALASYASSALALISVPLLARTTGFFKSHTFTWIIIILLLIALLLAFSLTGLMLVGGAALLAGLLYARTAIPRMLGTAVISLAVLFGVNRIVVLTTDADVLDLFRQRITSVVSGKASQEISTENIVGESFTQRTADYEVSMAVWADHPLTGCGPGCLHLSEAGSKHNGPFVATTYGSVAAELGSIGLIALVAMYLSLFLGSLHSERRWFEQRSGSATVLRAVACYLPFKVLLIILNAITANTIVSATLWIDVSLVLGCQRVLHQELGVEQYRRVNLVQSPLRNTVISWLRKGARVGTHH